MTFDIKIYTLIILLVCMITGFSLSMIWRGTSFLNWVFKGGLIINGLIAGSLALIYFGAPFKPIVSESFFITFTAIFYAFLTVIWSSNGRGNLVLKFFLCALSVALTFWIFIPK